MIYVSATCPNKLRSCNYIFNSAKLIRSNKDEWLLECPGCGEQFKREAPKRHGHKSQSYPYINGFLGEKVSSPEHEKALAKNMDMVKE